MDSRNTSLASTAASASIAAAEAARPWNGGYFPAAYLIGPVDRLQPHIETAACAAPPEAEDAALQEAATAFDGFAPDFFHRRLRLGERMPENRTKLHCSGPV